MRTFTSPLLWFFDGPGQLAAVDDFEAIRWRDLRRYGWSSESLDASDYGDIPRVAGVYVIVHEMEEVPLYVGETTNLAKRLRRIMHSKIRELIELYENALAGYHSREDVASEMRIFFKPVVAAWPALSLKQALIWHESIAVGLLCPIAQHNTNRLWEWNIQLGTGFFDREA